MGEALSISSRVLAPARNGYARKLGFWLPLALFGVLWADLIRMLSYQWEANEQYAYGWFVPFFALGLFLRKWAVRPAAQPLAGMRWLRAPALLLALALLPLRVIYEINPDWPLCAWLMTLSVVGLSLYAVLLQGGWRWVAHFAFPICFILVAVSWPYRIEHTLTQGLMRLVASLTVEVLGWFGIPAFQHGNLIEVVTGVVGIDEACSGIRSFQSTLMAALFLGELYSLKWLRRFLLLAAGVAVAFLFNVVRTTLLTWHASAAGIAALEKWHDPAGMMIFLAAFACLWGTALWLRSKSIPSQADERPERARSGNFPRPYLIALGCWALSVLALTEIWYRAHAIKETGVFHWSFAMPQSKPTFQKVDLAPRSVKLLAYDLGETGMWQEEGGHEWSAYFFRWRPNSVQSVIHSRLHRPDVCLPAAGLREISDAGVGYFSAGDLRLPFRKYTFESQGQRLYVFFCQWEDGPDNQTGLEGSKQEGRLHSVLTGRRFLGQQTLEIILSGCDSLEQAEAEVREKLPNLIRLDVASVPATPSQERAL